MGTKKKGYRVNWKDIETFDDFRELCGLAEVEVNFKLFKKDVPKSVGKYFKDGF